MTEKLAGDAGADDATPLRRDGVPPSAANRPTTHVVGLFAGETGAKSGEMRTHGLVAER